MMVVIAIPQMMAPCGHSPTLTQLLPPCLYIDAHLMLIMLSRAGQILRKSPHHSKLQVWVFRGKIDMTHAHPVGPGRGASSSVFSDTEDALQVTLKLLDMRMLIMARQPRPIHRGPELSFQEGHS